MHIGLVRELVLADLDDEIHRPLRLLEAILRLLCSLLLLLISALGLGALVLDHQIVDDKAGKKQNEHGDAGPHDRWMPTPPLTRAVQQRWPTRLDRLVVEITLE